MQSLIHPGQEAMTLPHPISVEMSVMRVKFMDRLITIGSLQPKSSTRRVRLFETGLRFIPDDSAENGVRQDKQ